MREWESLLGRCVLNSKKGHKKAKQQREITSCGKWVVVITILLQLRFVTVKLCVIKFHTNTHTLDKYQQQQREQKGVAKINE